MDHLEKIISGESKRELKSTKFSLSETIFLEYFTPNLKEGVLSKDLVATVIKDFFKSQGGDLRGLKNISKNPGQVLYQFAKLNIDTLAPCGFYAVPTIETSICRDTYKSLIGHDISWSVLRNARTMADLKAVLLIDHSLNSVRKRNLQNHLNYSPDQCLRDLIEIKNFEKGLDDLENIQAKISNNCSEAQKLTTQDVTPDIANKLNGLRKNLTKTLEEVSDYLQHQDYKDVVKPIKDTYDRAISIVSDYINNHTSQLLTSIELDFEPTYDIEKDFYKASENIGKLNKARENFRAFGLDAAPLDEKLRKAEMDFNSYEETYRDCKNLTAQIEKNNDFLNYLKNISYESLTEEDLESLSSSINFSAINANEYTKELTKTLEEIIDKIKSAANTKTSEIINSAYEKAKKLNMEFESSGNIEEDIERLESLEYKFTKAEFILDHFQEDTRSVAYQKDKIENRKYIFQNVVNNLKNLARYISSYGEYSKNVRLMIEDPAKREKTEEVCENILFLDKSLYYASCITNDKNCRPYIEQNAFEMLEYMKADRKDIEREIDYIHDVLLDKFEETKENQVSYEARNSALNRINPALKIRKKKNTKLYNRLETAMEQFCKLYIFHEKGYYRKFLPEQEPAIDFG